MIDGYRLSMVAATVAGAVFMSGGSTSDMERRTIAAEKYLAMALRENDRLQKEAGQSPVKIRSMEVEATAYLCVDPLERRSHGVTKSGIPCSPRWTVAVDPKVIPLGALMEINGRLYVAMDTGNMIRGHKIDIAVKSRKEAQAFGRKKIEVKIINYEA